MTRTDATTHAPDQIIEAKAFYDREFEGDRYTPSIRKDDVVRFAQEHDARCKACLEIGCGRGHYQDLSDNYTGVDLSETPKKFITNGRFVQASATDLPFEDNSFDLAWTIDTLEHVPDPEKALDEIRRVLRPGGVLYLKPAWQCRSWACKGYPVRPYSDFGIAGKLIKASIPVRNSVLWRSAYIFPRRVYRALAHRIAGGPTRFVFREIPANYETFWMSDSDACNSMDPYEAILWFLSRGDQVLSPATPKARFMVRTGAITVRVKPTA